jgi:superfamily I DNA/RNA helicase
MRAAHVASLPLLRSFFGLVEKIRLLIEQTPRATRDAVSGLPSSSLVADSHWHPLLLTRIKVLLAQVETKFHLKSTDNIGRKLSKRALPNVPLASVEDLADTDATALRVDTVHKAKGESLDAVLYMTLKEHALALLEGIETEVGRIGYVAATRARDLLWVAVPNSSLKELRPALLARGLKEVGIAAVPVILGPEVKVSTRSVSLMNATTTGL